MKKTDCGIMESVITVIADDVVIFAEMLEALVGPLDTLSTDFEPLGLKISGIKTKI